MPVAVLDMPSSVLGDEAIDAVRDCLHHLRDDERPKLFGLLDMMVRAIGAGDVTAATALVNRVADGPILRCLMRVAKPFMAVNRARLGGGVQLREVRHVYGRSRPACLGMFRGLSGSVAPVDVWACPVGLYWEKVEPDAFASVNTSRHGHVPVPLDWRHESKMVVGLSRRWELDDDGGLHGTFDMGSHPAAQLAARIAQSDEGLGLSMGVRFRTRWLAHSAPDEWDPRTGDLDMCVRDAASVEAVALTPTPVFPSATVRRVW